ncbi:MAG: CDP-alcohol phosphatidyltransferase family protein [Phycisphaerales bacterium]
MFIRIGPKTTEIPVAVLVPNFITTLSMCSGLASIHFSLMGKWEHAVAAIAMAMVFDALDGRAARMLRVSSKFGAVLDSLSDFVSFGVAPAIILHQWLLKPAVSPLELGAVMVFALCAGLRLARFTAAVPGVKPAAAPVTGGVASPVPNTTSNYFTGMPTPAGAATVMIPAMHELADWTAWKFPQWSIAALAFATGLLMVSTLPTFAFKKLSIRRPLVIPAMIVLGFVAVSLVTHLWLTLMIIASLNLALVPWSWFVRRRARMAALKAATAP